MGLLDLFRQKKPDPKFLGDFLSYQFFTAKFNLDMSKYDKELPSILKPLIESWIMLYLAYVYRLLVTSKHGSDVGDAMWKNAIALFHKAEAIHKEQNSAVPTLEYWMEKIDKATGEIGTEVNGITVPFEVFVAMTFLALDPASPFYIKNSLDIQKQCIENEYEVAGALSQAKDDAMPLMQHVIETGRYSRQS
jgi:hypothetical protein